MTNDEAATGVAYEVHDVPALERERDRARDRDRDDDRDTTEQARAMMLRRFARLRATAPVEPMS